MRDRGCRSIAVLRDSRINAFAANVQLICNGVSDSLVRLMRNKKLDVRGAVPRFFQDLAGNVSHRTNRHLEQLVALHFEKMVTGCKGLGGRRPPRSPTG